MKWPFNKKLLVIFLPLLIIGGVFLFGHVSWAAGVFEDWPGRLLGGILGIIIHALGLVLVLIIKGLMLIANYQNFIGSQAVVQGWVIVRDICNMFFVVILLVISFGTILRLENYSYKKWLPKLILMAVLINFSKTICGLLIDVAQVVMLSFVNAFKDVGSANMLDMLGISDILTFAKNNDKSDFWTIIAAYVLGLLYIIIAIVTIAAMLAMLTVRLVMIWIYVVLSPLAYLLSAVPGGQKYASQWWTQFIQNLVVGPVLAFFIWLSFAALQQGATVSVNPQETERTNQEIEYYTGASSTPLAATNASTPEALINFVIAIGMLLGGLKIAQEVGGMAASAAGKVSAGGFKFAKKWGKKVAMGDNYLARKFAAKTGIATPLAIKENWKAFTANQKSKDLLEAEQKAAAHFDAGGLRGAVLGVGAGKAYFDRYADGFLATKGMARGFKDVLVAPRRRKKLKAEIQAEEEKVKLLSADKEKLMTEDKKKELADEKAKAIRTDLPLRRMAQERAAAQTEMDQLEAKPWARLSADEKTRLAKLKADEAKLSKEESERTQEVTAQAEKQFYARDENKDIGQVVAELEISQASLKKAKGEIAKVQKPMAFESRTNYRKMVEESKSKYKTITNADELLQAINDAEERGDKYDTIALLEKLAGDANGNEILNARGYDANAVGLHKFVFDKPNVNNQNRGLKGNFSDKERLRIQNDLGELEERVGHWEMAKMVGMNSVGEMESLVKPKMKNGQVETDVRGNVVYDDMDHAKAAYAEVLKMDPQKIVNSLNRLAIGGEDGNGTFQMSTLGKMITRYLGSTGVFKAQAGRIVGNMAANLTLPHIEPLLRKLITVTKDKDGNPIEGADAQAAELDKLINLLKSRSQAGTASVKVDDMADFLRQNNLL